MKAHDSFLTSLLKLSDAVFNIPVYQRNYDWGTENCQQLFSDIEMITLTQKDHFIGSIVYISIGTATEPYYNIIDGQQRITSVMLFLKALHDISDDPKFKKQIRHSFLINIGLDDEPKMKLKQIESDSGVYEKIILQEEYKEELFSASEKESNVYKNYVYFMELISQSASTPQELYNAIFKLEIIDVCLTTEDPQEVFESMNSTGKSLTNTDLLRNYLLMGLMHSKQETLYKKYWSKIEENVGKADMDLFMVHYLIMKRKSDSMHIRRRSSKINKNTLYECYKIYLPPEKKNEEITESLLKDMYLHSTLYKRIINNEGKNDLDKAFNEVMIDLNADAVAIFLMYLLSIQEVNSLSDNDILNAVNACASYVFRVRMFKGSVSNQFFALAIQTFEKLDDTKPFMDRIWETLVSGQGSYRFPRDREFQNALETKDLYLEFKPPMIRYILYKYEYERTKEIVEKDSVSIEHVLPQDSSKWIKHLLEVKDTGYSDSIHKIGNLTLTKYNTEASNDSFVVKKAIYKNSGYAITREIAAKDDWTSKDIRNRSISMSKEALKLWPLPEIYNKDIVINEQIELMDENIEELFVQLRTLIKEYYPAIYEESKKGYINFIKDKKIVISVIPRQQDILIALNADLEQLDTKVPVEKATDRLYVGNSRIRVETEDDVWSVLDCIAQIIK